MLHDQNGKSIGIDMFDLIQLAKRFRWYVDQHAKNDYDASIIKTFAPSIREYDAKLEGSYFGDKHP
jgi:hypothetical protein